MAYARQTRCMCEGRVVLVEHARRGTAHARQTRCMCGWPPRLDSNGENCTLPSHRGLPRGPGRETFEKNMSKVTIYHQRATKDKHNWIIFHITRDVQNSNCNGAGEDHVRICGHDRRVSGICKTKREGIWPFVGKPQLVRVRFGQRHMRVSCESEVVAWRKHGGCQQMASGVIRKIIPVCAQSPPPLYR